MTSIIVTPQNQQEFHLLSEMLQRMRFKFKPIEVNSSINEDNSWEQFAINTFAMGYGEDEPDYENAVIKEPNPDYKP